MINCRPYNIVRPRGPAPHRTHGTVPLDLGVATPLLGRRGRRQQWSAPEGGEGELALLCFCFACLLAFALLCFLPCLLFACSLAFRFSLLLLLRFYFRFACLLLLLLVLLLPLLLACLSLSCSLCFCLLKPQKNTKNH